MRSVLKMCHLVDWLSMSSGTCRGWRNSDSEADADAGADPGTDADADADADANADADSRDGGFEANPWHATTLNFCCNSCKNYKRGFSQTTTYALYLVAAAAMQVKPGGGEQ